MFAFTIGCQYTTSGPKSFMSLTKNTQYIFTSANLLNDGSFAFLQCLLLCIIHFDSLFMHDINNIDNSLDVFGWDQTEQFSADPRRSDLHQVRNELTLDSGLEDCWAGVGMSIVLTKSNILLT